MQVVKQSKFGDVDSVRYNLYLSSTEYNDLRKLLITVTVSDSDPSFEVTRDNFAKTFISEFTLRRLKSLTSQFCLEL